jgi:hypothetical protein
MLAVVLLDLRKSPGPPWRPLEWHAIPKGALLFWCGPPDTGRRGTHIVPKTCPVPM